MTKTTTTQTQNQVQPQALSPFDGAERLLQSNSETASARSAITPQPVDEVSVASAQPAQDLEQQSSAIAPPENKTPKLNHTPVEELSPDEAAERQQLEMKYEVVFYKAGAVLRKLRNKRLYRNTHKTWEEYCYDRFELNHRCANLKILAADVIDNLKSELGSNCSQILLKSELGSNCSQILPTNESQCRQLGSLPDGKQQLEAWLEAIKRTSGKKRPSASTIKKVVDEMKGPVERLKQKNPALPASADQTSEELLGKEETEDKLPEEKTEVPAQKNPPLLASADRTSEELLGKEETEDKLPEEKTEALANFHLSNHSCNKAVAADRGDDLAKDKTEIETQSLFKVGRLIGITALGQQDHKWFGEVVEFKAATATIIEVVVKIRCKTEKNISCRLND